MDNWLIILIAALSLVFLIVLSTILWFLAILLIINFIILNLDTVFTTRPVRFAFTTAQAIAETDKARARVHLIRTPEVLFSDGATHHCWVVLRGS
ncbi:hypothetical protein GGR51DRAFT_558842 [Nemania sp. FL0031]|nr:hypothetical protein GGR51DRAFT_558842 [Nemania sp. FL0031]